MRILLVGSPVQVNGSLVLKYWRPLIARPVIPTSSTIEYSGAWRVQEQAEITVLELKRLIDNHARVNLIDVREPHEYDLCHIEGSRLVPLRQIPTILKELDPKDEYVLYCHVGDRSLFAVNYLRHLGFGKVRNLKGGIDRWAKEIDPSMPRY